MTYWQKRAAPYVPNATRFNRVSGEGPFALLSCKSGESRFVSLFLDENDRNRKLWRWDTNGCGCRNCQDDHRMIDIGNSNETQKTIDEATVHAAG